jgi:DNA polymerase I-like protein with 3'-5' exonuclease and polymerase domains
MELFNKTYEEINASKGTDFDMYTRAKSGMFGFLYGGDFNTWNQKLAIPLEQAKKAYDKWCAKYPGIGKARMRIFDDFCSMRQPGGIGTQVVWKDPSDYCETFLGFRRYFTLENKICKALFYLANKPPAAWRACPIKVTRRDRVQTAGGAVQSALFGAAFQIQAADMRAANNHLIQSPGAQITKAVQRKVWDLQPSGVGPLLVAPINIHDEILCVTRPDVVDAVANTVEQAVEAFRPQVKLIGLKWQLSMANWAEKKSGSKTLHITWKK